MTPLYTVCQVMWIGGTILIFASWVHAVSYTFGWLGFGIALGGTLLSVVAKQIAHEAQEVGSAYQAPSANSDASADRPNN
jgi:hypothetical protein